MHCQATQLEDKGPDLVLGFPGRSAVGAVSFCAVAC